MQAYYDEWYLAGMTVKEEHSFDVAVAWQTPSSYAEYPGEDWLWQLARGLVGSFSTGQDCYGDVYNPADYDPAAQPPVCNGDEKRDITIGPSGNTTIQDRFDDAGSVGPDDDRRWGIPKDSLSVETFSYASEAEVAKVTMYETPRILRDNFGAGGGAAATPSLLVATEYTNRSTTMDAAAFAVSDSGDGGLTLDFANLNPTTTTLVKWAPYRYNPDAGPDGVIGWENYPMADYWDHMELVYKAGLRDFYAGQGQPKEDLWLEGAVAVLRSFYLTLYTGMRSTVMAGGSLTFTVADATESSDLALAKAIKGIIYDGFQDLSTMVDDFVKAAEPMWTTMKAVIELVKTGAIKTILGTTYTKADKFLMAIGEGFATTLTSWANAFKPSNFAKISTGGKVGVVLLVGMAAVAVAACISSMAMGANAAEVIASVMLAINIIMTLKTLLQQVQELAKSTTQITKAAICNAAAFAKAASGVAVVATLIVQIVVTWALAIVVMCLTDMSRIDLGVTIAGAIASSIVLGIMFVIGCIPVIGQLLQSLIWLIDYFITAICGWLPEDMQESDAAKWLCGGLQGIVTNVLQNLIYAGNIMVDLKERDLEPDEKSRIEFISMDLNDLEFPDQGIRAGNSILLGLTISNTIDMISRPANIGGAYPYEYSDGNLKSSTFSYKLQDSETDFHDDLDRHTMKSEWKYLDGGTTAAWGDAGHTWKAAEPMYITRTLRSATSVPFGDAGLNRHLTEYLSEAWAIPEQNCILGICTVWTNRDSRHYNLSDSLVFDVFPAKLDDFYDLSCESAAGVSGCRQSWGGAVQFPALRDADGDGLPRGADPDDTRWDADLDGLSDVFERQHGSDPSSRDTDGDGLGDYEEILAGASPTRPDTDGDGLRDGEEVFHRDEFDQDDDGNTTEWVGGWELVYSMNDDGAANRTWVISDPLMADTDYDTLMDSLEKIYGLNPQVPSRGTVLTLQSEVREPDGSGGYATSDNIMMAGQTFHYTATVKNELMNRYAQGLLDTSFPSAATDTSLPAESFVLQPLEQQSLAGDVAVKPAAASGVYTFTQVAGAYVIDWAELAKNALGWLPFEDAAGSTTFADRSGSIPPHDGTCVRDLRDRRGRQVRRGAEPGRERDGEQHPEPAGETRTAFPSGSRRPRQAQGFSRWMTRTGCRSI